MSFLRKCLAFVLVLFLLAIISFNVSLYYQAQYQNYGEHRLNQDLIQQLSHLEQELHAGAAKEMQSLFPEGFVFLNSLYGLTWLEMIAPLSDEHELFQKGEQEIDWVLESLQSSEAKRPFDKNLLPEYGIFYRAWTNYLIGKKLQIKGLENADTALVQVFKKNVADIVEAVLVRKVPYLESYYGACWPADMLVGIASVSLHEKLFPGSYDDFLHNWLREVKDLEDKKDLIPHSCNCITGQTKEAARGSSQSLILNFLLEIDAEYGKEKFQIYRDLFLDERLGLPGIREYPKGSQGRGDIDSGPVIWGIGGSASIVGQRTMYRFGDTTTAMGLRNSIETFGLGNRSGEKKSYLMEQLVMADAFIAWSNSLEVLESESMQVSDNWRSKTQFYSFLTCLLIGLCIYFLLKKRK